MSEATLQGHAGLVFPSFDEESSYLEAVTVTDHAQAVERFKAEGADWGCEPELKRVWMRYVQADEAERMMKAGDVYADGPTFWWECDENHPEAVPFWKDGT